MEIEGGEEIALDVEGVVDCIDKVVDDRVLEYCIIVYSLEKLSVDSSSVGPLREETTVVS